MTFRCVSRLQQEPLATPRNTHTHKLEGARGGKKGGGKQVGRKQQETKKNKNNNNMVPQHTL